MLNLELGLRAVANNAGLYKKLLAKLIIQADEAIPQIEKALADNDRELATRTAHSLKGASISLGAENLSAAAANMETALKNNAENPELTASLFYEIQEAKNSINNYLANNA